MNKQNLINHISDLVKRNHITSTQFRYVCQQVRIKCNLQLPKRHKKLPDYLNAAEIYQLLSNEDDMKTSLLIEFLIFTGLRISETQKLMIQDIDFNNNQLKVIRGKGSKDRYVPLTSNLIHKIKLFINGRTRGVLFVKSDNQPYSKRALQKRVTQSLNKLNLTKKLSTHSLRHTFACLCLARGLSLEKIKLIMGHSSIKTTEIYAKLELGSVKTEFLSLMDQRG